ncbi:hypothetical protein V8E54_007701 [Elaphomyces granulatus]
MAKDQYLAGKLAVITGAGKLNGIGAAAAYALAEHGANIVIHYGKSSAAAAETVAISVDQESETFGQDLIQATLKAFNTETIDIKLLITHTHDRFQQGTGTFYPDIESINDWMFRTNVCGPLLLVQAAIPYLASLGGRIVNIGSIIARSGLSSWQRSVAPGPIETDMAFPEDPKFRSEQHIKRNGTSMEVAETILFLASPMAAYVTGQQVYVDGGLIYP